MSYKLYYSLRSPFARRARLALERLLIPYEGKEENAFEPTSEFLIVNPLGLLPALVTPQGLQLCDSSTILEYLHERHGQRVWPADLDERARVRIAATWAEGVMTMTVNQYLEGQRAHPSLEWRADYSDTIRRTLDRLHALAGSEFPFVRGSELTQAGYDLITALDYLSLRAPYIQWSQHYPRFRAFYDKHASNALLKRTVPPAA